MEPRDVLSILALMTPAEIALMLEIDPTFEIPNGVEFARIKMRTSRQIYRRAMHTVSGIENELVGCHPADVEHEATDPMWRPKPKHPLPSEIAEMHSTLEKDDHENQVPELRKRKVKSHRQPRKLRRRKDSSPAAVLKLHSAIHDAGVHHARPRKRVA